jgi:hypothetical protein
MQTPLLARTTPSVRNAFLRTRINVVRVHRRAEHGFGPVVELSLDAGDAVTTPLFPGLELRLADIFKS